MFRARITFFTFGKTALGYVFRPCPPNHPALKASKGANERFVLLSYTVTIDPKLEVVPRRFLNFCTRTVIGSIWKHMLHVAQDVRDGKRPEFQECFQNKRSLYERIEKRARIIIEGLPPPTITNITIITTPHLHNAVGLTAKPLDSRSESRDIGQNDVDPAVDDETVKAETRMIRVNHPNSEKKEPDESDGMITSKFHT